MKSIKRLVTKNLKTLAYPGLEVPKSLSKQIKLIQQLAFTSVYLVFDQFEELFIEGKKKEQKKFFSFLRKLLDSGFSGRVILVMREEFIANLWPFEALIPSLYNYRYRIESMRNPKVLEVIHKTLKHVEEITFEEGVPNLILNKLKDKSGKVELAYLQVYLDQLYKRAKMNTPQGKVVFDSELIPEKEELGDVIDQFLEKQLNLLGSDLGEGKEDAPIRLLGTMVTDKRTRRAIELESLQDVAKEFRLSQEELDLCLSTFENMRILHRLDL